MMQVLSPPAETGHSTLLQIHLQHPDGVVGVPVHGKGAGLDGLKSSLKLNQLYDSVILPFHSMPQFMPVQALLCQPEM